MRTFIALVLLAAVASNGFIQKYGSLKGSFYSDFSVSGSTKDTDAPMVSDFMIEGSAGAFMILANETNSFHVTYTVDDDDDMTMCTVTFWMGEEGDDMYAVWEKMTYDTGAQDLLFTIDPTSWEGEYMGMINCMDMTGNMAWWNADDEPAIPSVWVYNNQVDMMPYELDAYNYDGPSNVDLNDGDSDDPYVDVLDTITVTITYDNAAVGPQAAYNPTGAVAWINFKPDSDILEETDTMFAGTCAGSDNGGVCTWTWPIMSTWDFGKYKISSLGVSDMAGNWAWMTSGLDDMTFSLGDAPDEVISCQSLDMDEDNYPDQDSTVDADGQDGMLYLVATCNSQSALESSYNFVDVVYGTDINCDVYGDTVSTLAGASYNDYPNYLDYDTSEAYLMVTFNDGVPSGKYRLDSLTTTTEWGGQQIYSFAEGGAATVSCAFGAVVAVVVALLL